MFCIFLPALESRLERARQWRCGCACTQDLTVYIMYGMYLCTVRDGGDGRGGGLDVRVMSQEVRR